MIMQGSTVFDVVSSVLMELAVKALITSRWISSHFIRPYEIRFILYVLKDLVHWLFKHQVNYLRVIP